MTTQYLTLFHNINGSFFLPPFSRILLSRKWQITGFFMLKDSKSESLSLENLTPSNPFLYTWFTMRSSIPMWRRNVDMSSAEKSYRLPLAGISISCSGMNFSLGLALEGRLRDWWTWCWGVGGDTCIWGGEVVPFGEVGGDMLVSQSPYSLLARKPLLRSFSGLQAPFNSVHDCVTPYTRCWGVEFEPLDSRFIVYCFIFTNRTGSAMLFRLLPPGYVWVFFRIVSQIPRDLSIPFDLLL